MLLLILKNGSPNLRESFLMLPCLALNPIQNNIRPSYNDIKSYYDDEKTC